MRLQFVSLAALVTFAGASLVSAQTPTPEASPSPAKHRAHKAKVSPTPAIESAADTSSATPAASALPSKRRIHKKAESPAAGTESGSAASSATATPSPSPAKSHRRKKTAEAAGSMSATPAPVASATPRPNLLGRIFSKPSPTPAVATNPAPERGLGNASTNATPMPGGGPGMVWVNTESHVFHREGSHYYGKTKQGKYMTEAEALKEGDRAAAGSR